MTKYSEPGRRPTLDLQSDLVSGFAAIELSRDEELETEERRVLSYNGTLSILNALETAADGSPDILGEIVASDDGNYLRAAFNIGEALGLGTHYPLAVELIGEQLTDQ